MDDQQNDQEPSNYIECDNDINQRSSECDTQREETVYGGSQGSGDNTDDDDDRGPVKRVTKRVQKFSDSESNEDKENKVNIPLSKSSSSDSDQDSNLKTKNPKSRLKIRSHIDSSDSDSSSNEALKNEQQQLRMKNKRNKLKEKFKSLMSSRLSEAQVEKQVNSYSGNESDSNRNDKGKFVNSHSESESNSDGKGEDSSGGSDQETSIERIKQNIKEKTSSYKTTICDPDTSDEESHLTTKSVPQKKKERKTTKLTSPKPVRMTAKQAMENMKKIKSESNRMLREKEVTLPYHRPKALSLKDIMSRRRPAVSSDGKSLPIKMNEDQLRQYAKQLEERQKEMMELCKSDTDEDPDEDETQPEKLEESQKTNQSENSAPPESNQNIKIPESMETDNDDIKKSSDNTSVTNDNLTANVECVNEDEGMNDNDNASVENERNMEVIENNSDSILVEAEHNVSTLETNNVNDSNAVLAGSNIDKNTEEKVTDTANDSMNSNASNAEMSLVYNDSIEEGNITNENIETISKHEDENVAAGKETDGKNEGTEADSQFVSLHFDTEKTELNSDNMEVKEINKPQPSTSHDASDIAFDEVCKENEFSDDDMINMDEIDNLIENAEILKDDNGAEYTNSPILINDPINSKFKPKLTGAPGMVIDLDGTDAIARKKLTGLELLKERFTYFAKLKTPEELEREKEKRLKPGAQHLKLKHELEEKIAEQRSLEWAKRLEEEKQQQMEMSALRGDDSEDDIEKIEAKLEEKDEPVDEESSESEGSEEEMQKAEEKPRKRNPMIDDEAEESDVEEDPNDGEKENDQDNDPEDNNDDDSEDSSEESSESEDEMETTTKKGRILKAFEDSDEEEEKRETVITDANSEVKAVSEKTNEDKVNLQSQAILDSQDEDLQLAQLHKSFSEDLFTSQESASKGQSITPNEEPDIGTQTFSILNDATGSMVMDMDAPETMNVISETQPNDDPSLDSVVGMCSGSFSQNLVDSQFPATGIEKLSVISETQPNDEPNLDAVVGMCSGSFSQNLLTSQSSESQPIGEDILNLCTGKFYDNQFVSQANDSDIKCNDSSQITSEKIPTVIENKSNKSKPETEPNQDGNNIKPTQSKIHDDNNLKSILDELNDPEFEETKPKKYFVDNTSKDISNTQYKKKFIIDSDDETNNDEAETKKKKKIKKKKLEKRALQISDDEDDAYEEEYENDEEQEYMSDVENEDGVRLVEYDSEENEVEVKPQKEKKKKRKMAEFFEQEAELTSEDEWVGSGDEDERDLDRMEREEGDDETFNQRKLQRELGQIHMRDVLDQDKREVRIIQELLFEDGDLGDGHRQRKFRWRNADGEEEVGTVPDELADTQEEEMESEEQWRKQRHERELFLRQMQKEEETEEGLNVNINRTTIIKANLLSRTMSSLINEANNKTASEASKTSDTDSPVTLEKKSSKDIPSPKKAFTVFQQCYHGSLLSRGRGALARLAALAAPLAAGDHAGKCGALAPSSKRNFVFAALTQDDAEPKVTKRKAETNIGTPRLVKKMKTEDKKKPPRSSLLDHLKV